jgi:ribosomal protein S18 acetylase RimI-like enzyme
VRERAELVELANENFVASFAKLADHCRGGELRRFGGVVAYATGLPISLFNGCVVVEPAAAEDLDAALSWVEAHDVPRRVFVVEGLDRSLAPVAAAHGLERHTVLYPAMVLDPMPEVPRPSEGVVVTPIDESGRDEFLGVGVAIGLDRGLAATMFPDSLLEDADVDAFVGYLDGRAVGWSLAIRSERAGGVYNVGTLPEARRRGVGTALTWAAVDAGRRAGVDCVVLQSSEMAIAMYEAMGFRTIVRYADFRASVTPTGHETPVPPSPQ